MALPSSWKAPRAGATRASSRSKQGDLLIAHVRGANDVNPDSRASRRRLTPLRRRLSLCRTTDETRNERSQVSGLQLSRFHPMIPSVTKRDAVHGDIGRWVRRVLVA